MIDCKPGIGFDKFHKRQMVVMFSTDQTAGAGFADVVNRLVVTRMLVNPETTADIDFVAGAFTVPVKIAEDAQVGRLDQRFVSRWFMLFMNTHAPCFVLAKSNTRGAVA